MEKASGLLAFFVYGFWRTHAVRPYNKTTQKRRPSKMKAAFSQIAVSKMES